MINRKSFLSLSKNMALSFLYFGLTPFSILGKNIECASMSVGKRNNHILIIYASFHGSTAQIAEFMGKKLNTIGISASVKSIYDEIDFSSYSGIVMGSPIHRGKWMNDTLEFVDKNKVILDELLIACFFTCMSKAKYPPSAETLSELASYEASMTSLFPALPPSRIGSFAGELDYDKCSFLTKLVMWSIMSKNDLEAGDYRDWQAIAEWLNTIKKDIFSKIDSKITKVAT